MRRHCGVDSQSLMVSIHKEIVPVHTGIQGTAVQWGAWGSIGMVAANAAVLQRMERGGIQTVQPSVGLSVLSDTLLGSIGPQVCLDHHPPSLRRTDRVELGRIFQRWLNVFKLKLKCHPMQC